MLWKDLQVIVRKPLLFFLQNLRQQSNLCPLLVGDSVFWSSHESAPLSFPRRLLPLHDVRYVTQERRSLRHVRRRPLLSTPLRTDDVVAPQPGSPLAAAGKLCKNRSPRSFTLRRPLPSLSGTFTSWDGILLHAPGWRGRTRRASLVSWVTVSWWFFHVWCAVR